MVALMGLKDTNPATIQDVYIIVVVTLETFYNFKPLSDKSFVSD